MPELPTRAGIIVDAARKTGLLTHEGTATAGGAGTLTDTNILIHPANNDLQGYEIYIHTGIASGDIRTTSASTAASSLVTVVPNFSATPTTASQYIMFKRRPGVRITNLLLDGIDDAVRYLRNRKFTPKSNEEYIFQDLLWGYGGMQRWTAGASSAPDGWTLDGNSTIARSTTIGNRMVYSAEVTTDGVNVGTLSRSVAGYADYNGLSVTGYAWIRSDTASRVTVTITDGVTTNTSDALTVANTWYRIGPGQDIDLSALTIDENPTELTISVNASAGGAVVYLVNDVQLLLHGRDLSLIELPTANGYGPELTNFQYLSEIRYEEVRGSFNYENVYNIMDAEIVTRNSERYLTLDEGDISALSGKRMRLVGVSAPTLLTTNTATTSLDSNYLSSYAAWYAVRTLRVDPGLEDRLFQEWNSIERRMRETPPGNSILVERN